MARDPWYDKWEEWKARQGSSPTSLFKNAEGQAAYAALMPEPTKLVANNDDTGVRGWSAPPVATPAQVPLALQLQRERQVAEERRVLFEAQERARELSLQYGARGEELTVQNQQFQQRQDLELERERYRVWAEGEERAQRGQQFQQTGQQRAHEFETSRSDENQRFGASLQQRGYEFEQQRQPSQRDEFLAWEDRLAREQQLQQRSSEFDKNLGMDAERLREQAYQFDAQRHQRQQEFDASRQPSQRDQWMVETERQSRQHEMELQSYYKSLDFNKRQADELMALDDAAARIMNDKNLATFEKHELVQRIKYKRDILEEMRQRTQLKGMEQQQAQAKAEFERQTILQTEADTFRAKTAQQRLGTIQLPNGRVVSTLDMGQGKLHIFEDQEPPKGKPAAPFNYSQAVSQARAEAQVLFPNVDLSGRSAMGTVNEETQRAQDFIREGVRRRLYAHNETIDNKPEFRFDLEPPAVQQAFIQRFGQQAGQEWLKQHSAAVEARRSGIPQRINQQQMPETPEGTLPPPRPMPGLLQQSPGAGKQLEVLFGSNNGEESIAAQELHALLSKHASIDAMPPAEQQQYIDALRVLARTNPRYVPALNQAAAKLYK